MLGFMYCTSLVCSLVGVDLCFEGGTAGRMGWSGGFGGGVKPMGSDLFAADQPIRESKGQKLHINLHVEEGFI